MIFVSIGGRSGKFPSRSPHFHKASIKRSYYRTYTLTLQASVVFNWPILVICVLKETSSNTGRKLFQWGVFCLICKTVCRTKSFAVTMKLHYTEQCFWQSLYSFFPVVMCTLREQQWNPPATEHHGIQLYGTPIQSLVSCPPGSPPPLSSRSLMTLWGEIQLFPGLSLWSQRARGKTTRPFEREN